MHGFETLQEQAPEQTREHANRQKEAGPAGNPSLAVRRYAAARNDTVHMRMVLEVLAPAVQDSSDANVGAEVLAIDGNGGERFGCGREQQSIKVGFILVGDRADCGRQREHYVEVRHRQQFGLARCKPCRSGRPLTLGTVPIAAGVIGDARVGTVFAALDMPAWACGAPDSEWGQSAARAKAQRSLVGGAPS